ASGLPVAFSDLMMTVPEPGSALGQGLDPVSCTRREVAVYRSPSYGLATVSVMCPPGARTVASCTTTIYRPAAAPFQGHVSGAGHGETWNIRFSFPLTTLTGGSTG